MGPEWKQVINILWSVCVCYLCYDRQNAHHSDKYSDGCGGEINDLEGQTEMIITFYQLKGLAGVTKDIHT